MYGYNVTRYSRMDTLWYGHHLYVFHDLMLSKSQCRLACPSVTKTTCPELDSLYCCQLFHLEETKLYLTIVGSGIQYSVKWYHQ